MNNQGIMGPLLDDLRRRFIYHREIRVISRETVAKWLDVNRRTIDRFEGGFDGLNATTIDKIAVQVKAWEVDYERALKGDRERSDIRLLIALDSGNLNPPAPRFSFNPEREAVGAMGYACA